MSSYRTATLQVEGILRSSSESGVTSALQSRPGVHAVDTNAVSQTATVTYDPARTSVEQLSGWVRDCGYHCAGRSVPDHVCDPMGEGLADGPGPGEGHMDHGSHEGPECHDVARTPQDVMGHGGHHAGTSMDAMVRDMRNRFLLAAALSVPILLWSPIGREVLGFTAGTPFGLRDDVLSLLLSLPVVLYSAWIFFDGAWRALRARTLDMMVLVAVATGRAGCTAWASPSPAGVRCSTRRRRS